MTQPAPTPTPSSAFPPTVRPRQSVMGKIVPFMPIVVALTAAFIARSYFPTPQAHTMEAMTLLEGMKAPDFALADAHLADDQRVSLAELTKKAPVLMVFYLGYSCSRCMSHLHQLEGDEDLKKSGVQIVAISPWPNDRTRESIQQYGDFPFPLLADPKSTVARQYGLVDSHDIQMHGMYLIDQDQKIVWMERTMEPFQQLDIVLQRIRMLQLK